MASMRDIKRRRESIQSTEQITKAMKLVATVKLQKAKARAEESQPYFNAMYATVKSMLKKSGNINHPYLDGAGEGKKGKIVIATVKGDIHDIGKNIVNMLLGNHGFNVIDLGKDVTAEVIVAEAKRLDADVIALSALMTTTVGAMEETIKLLHEKAPGCRIIVGGAVLTQEYADRIGADRYAKDAMEAVRYAQEFYETGE